MNRALVITGGAILLASAIPHALFGWPPSAEQLRNSEVDPDLIAGLGMTGAAGERETTPSGSDT